ncbi:MAG: metallophosphoesterase [Clostridia bacterium]|nr:metallophosphoesterase [Clostridia bacterium]
MKLVVFSDVHYLDRKYHGTRKLTDYCLPLLDELIDRINNEIKPDVCICLGDIIQDTLNHDDDIKNMKFIWKKLNEIEVPFYTCIGNHDLKMMKSRKEVEEILGYDNANFSVDIEGYHLILLSTEVRNELGHEHGGIFKTQFMSEKDIEWLEKDVKKTSKPTILFTHYGLAEDDFKGNYWFEEDHDGALLKNRDAIKRIIRENDNIIGVFTGHQHWSKQILEDDVQYNIVGSLIENINDDGIPDGVYFEVDAIGNNIILKENHIRL